MEIQRLDQHATEILKIGRCARPALDYPHFLFIPHYLFCHRQASLQGSEIPNSHSHRSFHSLSLVRRYCSATAGYRLLKFTR